MDHRRQNRVNRLTTRIKGIILEGSQGSFDFEVIKDRHPVTWRLILDQLKKDKEESVLKFAAQADPLDI